MAKVSLEAVAKMFVQRDRPAETLPDVILRGKAATHGLSFPSGHAMVIFAIAALVAPYFKRGWKVLPWALAVAVCLSRVYVGAHFPCTSPPGRAWACSPEARSSPYSAYPATIPAPPTPADYREFACTARRDLVYALSG